jgi:hypothetical protein
MMSSQAVIASVLRVFFMYLIKVQVNPLQKGIRSPHIYPQPEAVSAGTGCVGDDAAACCRQCALDCIAVGFKPS